MPRQDFNGRTESPVFGLGGFSGGFTKSQRPHRHVPERASSEEGSDSDGC